MLLINCIAIVLGIISTTLMVILCIKTSMPYLKYFLATMVSLLCFFCSDLIILKMPEIVPETPEEIAFSFVWIPDLCFVLFMFFWILLVASLNEMNILLPVKYLTCICALYYIGIEILIYFHINNVIIWINLTFDMFLAFNGLYFLIYGLRHKYSFVNKYLIPFLGACMLIYSLFITYIDYLVVNQIDDNILKKWPEDPIIILGIAVEIITIVYFFYIDPLHLHSRDSADIDPTVLHEHFDLTVREVEIVTLLFDGLTNSEIAECAFISENTVKRHLTSIYKKTKTSNRYELLVKLIKKK